MKSKAQKKISERELDILQALWRIGEGNVAEVHNELQESKINLAYTTVQTMLNRLETKQIVARDNSERAHRYRPLVKEPSTIGGAIESLVKRFFNGSVEALATRLVEQELSREQIERIQSVIDAQSEKGNKQ
jgi:BlaI family transcriptional regulator, penicillinase repressor